MFGPSPNVLIQTCAISRLAPVQDADGGLDADASYVVVATNVPCSAQNYGSSREDSVDGRVDAYNSWIIFINSDYGILPNWRITLNSGEDIYVTNATDAAGRGASWQVDGKQRV